MCAAFSAAQAWTGAGQRRLVCTIMDAESFERVSFERLVSSASFLRAERVEHVAVAVYRPIIRTFDITSDARVSVKTGKTRAIATRATSASCPLVLLFPLAL